MPPSPDQLAETRALVQAEAAQRQQIEKLVAAAIVAEVRNFDGWYSSPRITQFAGRLAKLTRAGQRQTASSTSAYASRILNLLLGRRPATPGVIAVDDLRGIPLESVYGRLADQYRWLHADRGPGAVIEGGRPQLTDLEILDLVTDRAEIQTGDNLSLAMRDQWASVMESAPANVTGYRRVIHPEVIAEGSTVAGPVCALCVVAADRRYSRSELLPLHARCRCSVAPLIGEPGGDGDLGGQLNAEDLGAIYRAAGSTAAGDLKRTKVRVVDHGELGPRLTFAKYAFRDEATAARADATPPAIP